MKTLNLIGCFLAIGFASLASAAEYGYSYPSKGYANYFNYSIDLSDVQTSNWTAYTYAGDVGSYGITDYGSGNAALSVGASNYLAFALNNSTGSALSSFKISYSTVPEAVALQYVVVSEADLSSLSSYTTLKYTDWAPGVVLPNDYSIVLRWVSSSEAAYTLDSVVVRGSTIPEPSTYAMILGVATLGLVGWRRFRRK